MRWIRPLSVTLAAMAVVSTAGAQGFYNSPAGGTLPSGVGGVTPVGGLVADLVGTNGTRLVAQLSASSLFVGFYDSGDPAGYRGNPGIIGIQTGFTPVQVAALGGGLSSAAFRVSLYDGDTRPGDFDQNDVVFTVNGFSIQNFSAISTTQSDANGNSQSNTGSGFGNDILNTGFFFTSNVGTLSNIFASLSSTMQLVYRLNDIDPFDNFYDFTQGIDGGLINVGQPPVVVPPTTATPEPATVALFSTGLLALAGAARRRARA